MVAVTGHVVRKPMQRDMFTGELVDKKPKAGNGSHIRLKPTGLERPAVPGMASWAGGGPEGKRCGECQHFGSVAILRPDTATQESKSTACLLAARRQGRLVQGRYDISLSAACYQFAEHLSGERAWAIGPDGRVHGPDWHAKGLPRFFVLGHVPPPDHEARADWIAYRAG